MGAGGVPVTWLKLAWRFLGWRGALGVAGLLAAAGVGIMLLITSSRLDAARAKLETQQAACAADIAALEQRLAAAQAEAAALDASARALAGQVRETEAACARERQRRAQAREALAHTTPIPLAQAEESHAVDDLASSGRVARVLNDVFAGLCANATGPGGPSPGPGLPEPGAAGAVAPGPVRAPGQ